MFFQTGKVWEKMAESTSTKRQHEENNSESDDEFVGPLPSEALQTKTKKKKGMLTYRIWFSIFGVFIPNSVFFFSFGVWRSLFR